jgi:predicted PurR-regulated permease PerM
VLSGFVEIVPTVGPIISAVPPTLVALTVSPTKALWVLGLYTFIQQLESNILVPWIMSNKVRLHPVTLLFFLLGMAEFLGVFGALIATPLAAVLKVLYMELYYRRIHGTLPQDEAEDPIRMKILHRFAKRAQIGEPPGPPVAS